MCGEQVVSKGERCWGVCGRAGKRRAGGYRACGQKVGKWAACPWGCRNPPGALAAEPWGWQGTAAPGGPGSPGRAEGREVGGKGGWLQVAPAVGRSGGRRRRGTARGGEEQGAHPAGGAGSSGSPWQGHRSSSRCARCCRQRKGRGLERATCPSSGKHSLLSASYRCVCVCVEGVVAALTSPSLPLPGSSRQSPELAGCLVS